MEWIAKSRYARYAPRKTAQVLDLIRRKPVAEAFKILKFTPNSPAELIGKTLKSAIANSGRLKSQEGIYIKECWVDQGPPLKRWRARAYGRAAAYKRKTCHLTIKVSDSK